MVYFMLQPIGRIKRKQLYDTIRDAVLTTAQKLTWVSLIYRTEPTSNKWKTEKKYKGLCSELCIGKQAVQWVESVPKKESRKNV